MTSPSSPELLTPVFPEAFTAPVMSAEILAIGTELTQGLIVNSNAAWVCTQLLSLGVPVAAYSTVADHLDLAVDELLRSASRADLVIVTGGLGPTRDDLTRDVLARAAGVSLVTDQPSLDHIAEMFARRIQRPMTDNNRQQALIPVGSFALPNPIGTAPGIACLVGKARVFAFPGVPRELFAMFPHVANFLAQCPRPSGAIALRKFHCFGAGESEIDRRVRDLMDPHDNPFVALTVADAIVTVRLTACAATSEAAQALLAPHERDLRSRLADCIFSTDDRTLEEVTADALLANGLTVALAESCTGGSVAQSLTNVSGVSASFIEGLVTYSNASKTRRLGVPDNLIRDHGAVSPEVARAMAEAVRSQASADLGLGVTGIAGPTGGSPEKPVGLVYIAVASRLGAEVRQFQFHGDRAMVRKRATLNALNMLRLTAEKLASL